MDYNKLLDEIRQNRADIQNQNEEWEREEKRPRDYQEVKKIIADLKKEFPNPKKKRQPILRVSIQAEFLMDRNRYFYRLMIFEDKKLTDYNVQEDAAIILISGIKASNVSSFAYYLIYTNEFQE